MRNNRGNNKKRNGRTEPKGKKYASERPEEGKFDRAKCDPARNDIAWYSRNPNLLVAAGSFPFPNRPGMSVDFGKYNIWANDTANKAFNNQYVIPGVMVLDWIPSIGISNGATDPASILGREMYARVRSVYSGALDVDAPDFVMYVMALDSIFSYIAWLKRLYRLLNAWTPDNYILPDVVIHAMGFTQSEILGLRQNKAKLWQNINELVLQSRKFNCPASMDIMNRHYWMSDNVYTDGPTINSQFYLFNLKAVYRLDPNVPTGISGTGDPAAGLYIQPLPTSNRQIENGGHPITTDDLYNFGESLISMLVAWDDAYTINGYLKKAFEGDSLFIVDEIPADQPFNPVYEPEVLAQIENSRTVPGGNNIKLYPGFTVNQDPLTNAVISNPGYTISKSADSDNEVYSMTFNDANFLSIRSDAPTVADNVIASRLKAFVTSVTNGAGTDKNVSISCGTEVPLAWRYVDMFASQTTPGDSLMMNNHVPQHPCFSITGTAATDSLRMQDLGLVLKMEAFDWHPFAVVHLATLSSATTISSVVSAVVGDTHNIALIANKDLQNLHKICIYSEFNSFGML